MFWSLEIPFKTGFTVIIIIIITSGLDICAAGK